MGLYLIAQFLGFIFPNRLQWHKNMFICEFGWVFVSLRSFGDVQGDSINWRRSNGYLRGQVHDYIDRIYISDLAEINSYLILVQVILQGLMTIHCWNEQSVMLVSSFIQKGSWNIVNSKPPSYSTNNKSQQPLNLSS